MLILTDIFLHKESQYEGYQPLFTQCLAAPSTISEKVHFIISNNMKIKQHNELKRAPCWNTSFNPLHFARKHRGRWIRPLRTLWPWRLFNRSGLVWVWCYTILKSWQETIKGKLMALRWVIRIRQTFYRRIHRRDIRRSSGRFQSFLQPQWTNKVSPNSQKWVSPGSRRHSEGRAVNFHHSPTLKP